MPGYTLADGITVKNKLGATTHEELERLEVDLVRYRLFQLELGQGPKGKFDSAHLKAIHQHLFQDVFEWAGHTRDEAFRFSDGITASEPVLRKASGQSFTQGEDIQAKLKAVDYTIASRHFHLLPRNIFAMRAADVMTEINTIHPFREGNGRAQRAFMRELAREAGHNLDFSVVSKERMIQASIEGHENNDRTMMRRMFVEISDPRRAAALRDAITFFETQNFPWNEHYLATTEPGQKLEVVFAGHAGVHFMARTESQILIGNAVDLPDPQPDSGDRFLLTTSREPINREPPAGRDKPSGRGR